MSKASAGISSNVMPTLLDVIHDLTGMAVDPSSSINRPHRFGVDSLFFFNVICEITQRFGTLVPASALQNEKVML